MELSKVDNSDLLLSQKNVLDAGVIDKYRAAGQVCQSTLKYIVQLIHDSYHLNKMGKLLPSEICALGDSFLYKTVSGMYSKVQERGIAAPVSLNVNASVEGNAPELGTENSLNKYFVPGDVVKITFGAHIDGYTCQVSHSIVIYEPGAAPSGPLVGSKADAMCAAYIACEAVISMLGCSLSPEKLPQSLFLGGNNTAVTGHMIRNLVNGVAKSFGCVVVPGSRVRRVRRFLAGQAEKIVAEKEFKGCIWTEAHQEHDLLALAASKGNTALVEKNFNKLGVSEESAIPSDEFEVKPGEVWQVDLKMASVLSFQRPGLVSLQSLDTFTGKNNNKEELIASSNTYIRDFAVKYNLKLKSSRKLLSKVEEKSSVYPFKLFHLSEEFPFKDLNNVEEQFKNALKDLNKCRLGLSECLNNHLVVEKKLYVARFLDLETVLKSYNENALANWNATVNDLSALHNTMPGFEIPLPKLGISQLKLQNLLKNAPLVDVANESSTVVLNDFTGSKPNEVIRLSGGYTNFPPNWVHSEYKLENEDVIALIKLGQDAKFGLKVKECQPLM